MFFSLFLLLECRHYGLRSSSHLVPRGRSCVMRMVKLLWEAGTLISHQLPCWLLIP